MTPGSQQPFLKTFAQAFTGTMSQKMWIRMLIILATFCIFENSAWIKIVLTHWSMAQAGSNDGKNGGRKSRWSVHLKY